MGRSFVVRTPDQRDLSVVVGGAEAGPVVFYLHGTPMSSRLYGPHAEDAARRGLRLVGFDRPGYGSSTPFPGRSIGSIAADVLEIANHLGVEQFGVWGISGGGPHALACGALIPRRAIAVAALAAPAPYPADGLDWLASTGEANVAEFEASIQGAGATEAFLSPLRDAYLGSDPAAADASLETLLSPIDRAVFRGPLRTFLYESARSALLPGVAGWRDDDLAFVRPWGFDVSQVAVPTMLWQGRADLFVPYAHGKWLAERIPHAVQNLTEEDGHLTLYERRIPLVHAWLGKHLGR